MSHLVSDPEAYFSRLVPEGDPLLKELEEEARRDNTPIVGPVVGGLLYLLARISKAARILELGTAGGYSAFHLAQALSAEGGRLVTLEIDPKTAERARSNFQRAGVSQRIEIRIGDALETLSVLDGTFDDAESNLLLGYGRYFGDLVSLGASLRVAQQSIDGASDLGLGLDVFSMSAFTIPEVKKIIRTVSIWDAEELVGTIEEMRSVVEIDEYVNNWMHERFDIVTA